MLGAKCFAKYRSAMSALGESECRSSCGSQFMRRRCREVWVCSLGSLSCQLLKASQSGKMSIESVGTSFISSARRLYLPPHASQMYSLRKRLIKTAVFSLSTKAMGFELLNRSWLSPKRHCRSCQSAGRFIFLCTHCGGRCLRRLPVVVS